ncbi:MAG: hypothetical protein QOI80_2544 [Solirubrobacteraceae bacterium]|jgi:protein SCO1/2|nr:hypothetical protein [Solirubrobacteraceae bacterium]
MRSGATEVRDEHGLVAEVDRVRAGEAAPERLVEVLHEDAAVHRGHSTGATARVRGWVLAAFAEVGLPAAALPFVREELESGIEPYPVAGAARALRGGSADADVQDLLARAFVNLRTRDEPLSFDLLQPVWPAGSTTSALREILATAAWLTHGAPDRWQAVLDESNGLDPSLRDALARLASAAPTCCHGAPEPTADVTPDGSLAALTDLAVEDSTGETSTLGALTLGRPTVLTFFYTRCDNPNKCTLTIRKLGELQQRLGDAHILALTYDPGYDTPPRLARYAQDRGLHPAAGTTVGRLPGGNAAIEAALHLRVGHGGATVNRHAVQVFLLDAGGAVVAIWQRRDWDVGEVAAAATAATPTR